MSGPDETAKEQVYAYYLEMRADLGKLLGRVQDRLSSTEYGYIADFIEANEYALALEGIVDNFAVDKLAFSREEIEQIEALARKMNMYPAILLRYPDGLASKSLLDAIYLELREELRMLLESVRNRLSSTDYGNVIDCIDANEFALALEWMVEALAGKKLAITAEEIDWMKRLGRKIGIYPHILDYQPYGPAPGKP